MICQDKNSQGKTKGRKIYAVCRAGAAAFLAMSALTITGQAQQSDPLKNDKEARTRFDMAEFNRAFTHHTMQVGEGANSVKMHYVTGGKGEAVVLLHGYPATWYDYRMVMPLLAKKYTVIAVDLRGMGDSSKTLTGYDPHTMAEDVYQVIKNSAFNRLMSSDTTSVRRLLICTPCSIL